MNTHIIGGGIIGLTIALNLCQRGETVTLHDAETPFGGASLGNAGHIATEYNYPVASLAVLPRLPLMLMNPLGPLRIDWRYLPKMLPWGWQMLTNMLPARYRNNHRALLALNRESLAAWERLAAEWQLPPLLRHDGILHIASRAKTAARLPAHAAQLQALGFPCQYLSADELREFEPALARQHGGIHYQKSAHITDLAALGATLADRLRASGGDIREHSRITAARRENSGISLQTADGAHIHAERVILCAGAHSKALAENLTGVRVPLDTERGYHLMLPGEAARLRLPVSSIDHSFVMTPMQHGLRLAGTVEYAGLEAPPNMARARNLKLLAEKLLQAPLNGDGAEAWMGFRPTTADSLPVIDRDGDVLLAFGHQHLGLTQAALTAETLAALYFGETPPLDLTPYRLHRFT